MKHLHSLIQPTASTSSPTTSAVAAAAAIAAAMATAKTKKRKKKNVCLVNSSTGLHLVEVKTTKLC